MQHFTPVLPCAVALVGILFVLLIVGAVIGLLAWTGLSNSPRAAKLRRVSGMRRPGKGEPIIRFYPGDSARDVQREAARTLAAKHGFEYLGDDQSLAPRLAGFQLLAKQSAILEDVIRRNEERRSIEFFEYSWEFDLRLTREAAILVDEPGLRLPPFLLTGSLFQRLLGKREVAVTFDDDREFSMQFVLESSDPLRAKKLFDAPLRRELMNVENCSMECRETSLLFYTSNPLTELAERERFLEESLRILQAIESSARWA